MTGPEGDAGAGGRTGAGALDVDVSSPLANEERHEHRTRDGVRLRVLAWPVESPRGRVQLVHGRGEHLGRYREVAAWLNRAGLSVFGHDLRNHGESGGDQGVPGSFMHLVEDLAELRSRADGLAPGPGRPVLVAHSLGGLLAIRFLQRFLDGAGEPGAAEAGPDRRAPDGLPFAGVVLSAPWLRTAVEIPIWTRLLIPVLRVLAPGWAVPQKMRPELLTRDPERARAVMEDPLILRGVAIRFFDQVREAQDRALAAGLPPGMPVLVLVPGADGLVDPEATRRWARGLGPSAEIWELARTRHEPFNDVARNIIFQRLVEWLNPLVQREEEVR